MLHPTETHEVKQLAHAGAHVAGPPHVLERKEHLALHRVHAELVIGVLEEDGDLGGASARSKRAHGRTDHEHLAVKLTGVVGIEARQAIREGRLSRTRRTHEQHDLAGAHGKGEALEDGSLPIGIAKREVAGFERGGGDSSAVVPHAVAPLARGRSLRLPTHGSDRAHSP